MDAEVTKLVQAFMDQQTAAVGKLHVDLIALFHPRAPISTSPAPLSADDLKEQLRQANLVSGCGHDAGILRERFLHFLRNHEGPSAWISVFDMCSNEGRGTKAWSEFGKGATKIVLATLTDVAEFENMPPEFGTPAYLDFAVTTCNRKSRSTGESRIRLRTELPALDVY
jgi:hypothetical protein